MPKLTIASNPTKEDEFQVYLDGEAIEGVTAHKYSSRQGPKAYLISLEAEELSAFDDVMVDNCLDCVESLSISTYEAAQLFDGWVHYEMTIDGGDWAVSHDKNLRFTAQLDIESWARLYSLRENAEGLREVLSQSSDIYWPTGTYYQSDDSEDFLNELGFVTKVDGDKTLGELFKEMPAKLQGYLEEVELRLLENNPASITRIFKFPGTISTPCEQYLLYFGQFLKDLGINADSEIREQASRVLFTVTPSDSSEALDKIKEALDCYLQIPGSSVAEGELSNSKDIAILQLSANISHLRGQVALAAAVLQAKEATIDAHQTELTLLRNSLDLRRFAPGLKSSTNDESEQIIEGLVAVKKVDYKGLEINLPEVLRRLKRVIK